MRHINERGIEMVKSFEGISLKPYLCAANVWTVGYGCTVGSVGGPIDPDMEAISEVEALPYVTWTLPKDGFLGLLKRHLPKISIPL